jgi:hypothetical protein
VLVAACLGAATVVVLASPGSARAPRKCPDTTVDQNIGHADVVFRGQVTKAPTQTSGQQATITYKVRADRVYKASLVTDNVVVTARVGTRCALPQLKKGNRYIFFVTEHGSRLVATSGTAPATPTLTRQVTKRLGNGEEPTQTPPAAVEFTSVSGATPPTLSRLLAPGAALLIVSVLGLLFLGRRARRPA